MRLPSYFSFHKLVNVFLRISAIGSKFIVFTYLSKYFTDIEFGNYSLITSLVTIMIFVLGLDFYNFSIRDILKTKETSEIQKNIVSTVLLYLVIYTVFFVLGWAVFNQINFTKEYAFLIISLCVTEHFSQEIYRFLVGFNKVLFANILLFLRTFIWGTYVLFLSYMGKSISIEFILKIWTVSNALTILITLVSSLKYIDSKSISINYNWISKGLKVSSLFFISTIFLKLIEYANRFVVDIYLGKEMVGVYTFYSSIAILITVYINTIVISFELPNILKASNEAQDQQLFPKFKKSLLVQNIVISIILLLIIYPILWWQNKPIFQEFQPILYFMIIGVVLMNYSLYYHFKLYVKHFDKQLVKTIVVSGIISLVLAIIATKYFGIYGAALAFSLSGGVLFYCRYYEVKKLKL